MGNVTNNKRKSIFFIRVSIFGYTTNIMKKMDILRKEYCNTIIFSILENNAYKGEIYQVKIKLFTIFLNALNCSEKYILEKNLRMKS
jgi:hypothetical protein